MKPSSQSVALSVKFYKKEHRYFCRHFLIFQGMFESIDRYLTTDISEYFGRGNQDFKLQLNSITVDYLIDLQRFPKGSLLFAADDQMLQSPIADVSLKGMW